MIIKYPNVCSTLPSLGYSMWNPWTGGWTAEIPDGFHGMRDGIHTFSTWNPYLFHMESICLVGGFHGISRWIPYGMSSWNHNYTLILYHFQGGIHMDSIWTDFME
jgi:hypothetical protein